MSVTGNTSTVVRESGLKGKAAAKVQEENELLAQELAAMDQRCVCVCVFVCVWERERERERER